MSGARRRKPWAADDRARLAALYARGLTYAEIATALGRTLGAIKQALYQEHVAARRPGRGAHAGAGHQRRRPAPVSRAARAVLDAFLRKPAPGGGA